MATKIPTMNAARQHIQSIRADAESQSRPNVSSAAPPLNQPTATAPGNQGAETSSDLDMACISADGAVASAMQQVLALALNRDPPALLLGDTAPRADESR